MIFTLGLCGFCRCDGGVDLGDQPKGRQTACQPDRSIYQSIARDVTLKRLIRPPLSPLPVATSKQTKLTPVTYNAQVEACFRVGDNRDEVLLGVAHTLGVRLTCSSVHDVKAAVAAARRVSASAAPSPRLLDTHVCRPPSLLRVSSAAGVQVYEVCIAVDCSSHFFGGGVTDKSQTVDCRFWHVSQR